MSINTKYRVRISFQPWDSVGKTTLQNSDENTRHAISKTLAEDILRKWGDDECYQLSKDIIYKRLGLLLSLYKNDEMICVQASTIFFFLTIDTMLLLPQASIVMTSTPLLDYNHKLWGKIEPFSCNLLLTRATVFSHRWHKSNNAVAIYVKSGLGEMVSVSRANESPRISYTQWVLLISFSLLYFIWFSSSQSELIYWIACE